MRSLKRNFSKNWRAKVVGKYRTITLFLFLLLVGCKQDLIHDLAEIDANRVISALNGQGITGIKEVQTDGKWRILVESDEMASALSLITEQRIVKADTKGSSRRGTLVSSREQQRFEYERSLSQEIEKTLMTLGDIVDARVHLNLPVIDPILGLKSDKFYGSASALLISRATSNLQKEELARLVAGASGIDPSMVTVIESKLADATKTLKPTLENPPENVEQITATLADFLEPKLLLIIVVVVPVPFLLFMYRRQRNADLIALQSKFEAVGR